MHRSSFTSGRSSLRAESAREGVSGRYLQVAQPVGDGDYESPNERALAHLIHLALNRILATTYFNSVADIYLLPGWVRFLNAQRKGQQTAFLLMVLTL